jgi:hypothetical protein
VFFCHLIMIEFLPLLLLAAALLYSSVGHGGASGYLAAMALVGVLPEQMRPAALVMNVVVASVSCWKFNRVQKIDWVLLLPLIAASVPMAFVGGAMQLPSSLYKQLVGATLVFAAIRSLLTATQADHIAVRRPAWPWLVLTGAGLGLLSGLTGVGGGIFLSPIIVLFHWTSMRQSAGVAAAFITLNSIAGLTGLLTHGAAFAPQLPIWIVAVVVGGWLGAEWGSRRLGQTPLQRVLAVVLVVAGLKMLFVH